MKKVYWDYKEVADAYDPAYNPKMSDFGGKKNRAVKALREVCKPNSKILEVGCATGRYYGALKEFFPSISTGYVGIDITPKMIERAKMRHPDGNFRLGDACDLNFEDDSFDVVLSTEVLIHVGECEKALKELYRVCKSYLIISVRMKDIGKTVVDIDKFYQTGPHELRAHYNIFDREEFIDLLKELNPKPISILGDMKWYVLDPSIHVPFEDKSVISACLLIEKGLNNNNLTNVELNVENRTSGLIKSRIANYLDRNIIGKVILKCLRKCINR